MTSSRFGSTVSRRAVVDYGLSGALKLWWGRSTNRLFSVHAFRACSIQPFFSKTLSWGLLPAEHEWELR